jgi:cytochrome c oxidase cbb3-type subunit III
MRGCRFALLFTTLVVASIRSSAQEVGSANERAKRGKTQFGQSCGFCHGPDATGGAEGPNLIRSALLRHDENGNLIAPVIRDGRPQKGMPPVPLSDSQIADVVAFLHRRLQETDLTSPADPREYDLKTLFTGNPVAGKEFFYGAGQCSRCHSPSGDLAGIANKYAPTDLQAHFLYPPDIPKSATVTTRSGAQLTGTLFYEDQFNVAIKDKAGWYHSWPCSEVRVQIHDPVAAHLELLHKYTEPDVHNVFAYLETLK